MELFSHFTHSFIGLEPKFAKIAQDHDDPNLPLVFADLSIKDNKEFVQSIGVLALPTVQFYVGESLKDTFPCGPSRLPILKRKLAQLIEDHVDETTGQLKAPKVSSSSPANNTESLTSGSFEVDFFSKPTVQPVAMTMPERNRIRSSVPYFQNMNLADADACFDQAKKVTFPSGSVIMKEGIPGRTFYVLEAGNVEICQKTQAEDPMSLPSSYLGSVINVLSKGDFFGERGLITGEPRAASLRATEEVTAWTFDKDIFPHSSPLSGRTKGTKGMDDDLENMNDKYGVTLSGVVENGMSKQLSDAKKANQIRGSANTPEFLVGVDSDEVAEKVPSLAESDDNIFSLLNRFKMIRHVSRCLHYMSTNHVTWGDAGIRKRRSLLVQHLTPSQHQEFVDTFDLIDDSRDGSISVKELKRVIESIGDGKSDDELRSIILQSHEEEEDDLPEMNLQDFLGIMAEAEFFRLFSDIFSSLDKNGSGFVKARDLNNVLSGVRDLISSDRRSIIDVAETDMEMLIDYQMFSKMMLGSAL